MEETYKNKITEESNDPAHYKLITVGVIVGVFGIFLRYTGSWTMINVVSNIIFVVGIYICLKAILRILK